MKTHWGFRGTQHIDPGAWKRIRGSALVLALLLLLLLIPLLAGCDIVEELTVTSETDALGSPTPAGTELEVGSTGETVAALPESTSTTRMVATADSKMTTTTIEHLASTTTATELATTTTSSASTSTTVPETTTLAEDTTTSVVEDTTTTVPESALAPETTDTTPPAIVTAAETENVLYEITDWSEGVSGWAAAGQWKTVGGMLVTDGSSDSFALAPVDLTDYPDYAVECEIQLLNPRADTDVFLIARMINGCGYWAGFDSNNTRMIIGYGSYGKRSLTRVDFVLDGNWHKYRLEVRGNTLKLFFEEAEVARAMDNRALDPGTVGIYCGNGQINVRAFRVIAL